MDDKIYQFDDYLLDVSQQRLQKNGADISLPPKVFEVLAALLERHGQLVTYQELMDKVWQDTFVEETNLRYSIHTLRKTFPEDFIETVPKRGYRFKAEVADFTAEEFIKKHTGNFKFDDLTEARPKKSVGKYAAIAAVALLMAGIGFAAFYFWQSKPADSKHLKHIAVLPFSVIGESSEKNPEIQKGLADALAFNLEKIRGLKISGGGESDSDAIEIGKKLRADEVLNGTYRIEGNSARINFQLVRVSDGETILAKTFTVSEENRLETENSAALQITRQIDLYIARLKDELKIKNINLSEEASRNYLTAKRILRENEFNRWHEATELMKKTVAENPNWVYGYAGFAEALVMTHGELGGCQEAAPAARKAIELDASVAEAFMVLGFCHQYNREWKEAEENYRKAIEISPNLDRAYVEYGAMLDFQRRFAEAETNLKKAVELAPFVPFYLVALCDHYYFDVRYAEALKHCRQAQKIEPTYWQTTKRFHWIYVQQGRYDEVEKLKFGKLSPEEKLKNPEAKALLEGDIQKFWEINLQTRLASTDKRRSPVAIATFYAKLGNKEKTLEYLEQAAETLEYELYRANANPIFTFVRKEPRYAELMKKLNLQP